MIDMKAILARTSTLVCVGTALSACSTIPAYHAPDVAVPAHYASAPHLGAGWATAAPADGKSRGPWWSVFNDETLNRLEARVAVSNQTVSQAVARLEAARAALGYQQSALAPTVTAGAGAQRYRTSQSLVDRALAGKTIPDYSVGAGVSWEPDLFGRVRNATTAARDNVQVSQADLESVRLSVASQLASAYLDLRSLDRQQQLLGRTVTTYEAGLRIVEQQLADGAIDASALSQARTQLESARTANQEIEAQRAQLQHAIATLIGTPASSFSLPQDATAVVLPSIPAGVPSALLQRRPDIAAAERRVAAANAEIGQARAAYFPSLVLSASTGLESTFFAPWLSAPSLFWSLGAQVAGVLFDGGRRDATLKGASARYDEAVAGYRQTVLMAFQQTEDDLSELNSLAEQARSQQRAAAGAELALTLANHRYEAGAVSYLDVVATQSIALQNERTLEQIRQRQLDASVRLLQALGGGWDRKALQDDASPASETIAAQ
ncbi:efflux transporter outer membrane subunit [Pandoraea sp. SD6-2]|uniref:efflux transporter outer membrane subunit n=1 Tax=Pandoraea sp. SD6-2 TaxID=1286093 RepID=UPI00032DD558|nr:efflux transporter outer membrane subunit [Pandoraea sp. SD6-2]EON14549.1 RND efflux system outer membrane lipoprotein [Pandoraea sp. SD6-2]